MWESGDARSGSRGPRSAQLERPSQRLYDDGIALARRERGHWVMTTIWQGTGMTVQGCIAWQPLFQHVQGGG